MNIGELAQRTGVSIRSLRYYEMKRLLSPMRQENGYRSYSQEAINQVKKIQFYLGLGLNTKEIQDVLFCEIDCASPYDPEEICPEDKTFIREKLEVIEAQIAALEKARQYLRKQLDSPSPSLILT